MVTNETRTPHVNDPAVIRRRLTDPGTWAVVGLSRNTARPAHGVARWLKHERGATIVPIHPAAEAVDGDPAYASLADLPEGARIDVIDCFVASERVGAVVDEAIAQRDRLGIGAVWLQLGVVDEAAAARAAEAGLEVVMDTCPRIEWPRVATRG